jgi:hypothetical protein
MPEETRILESRLLSTQIRLKDPEAIARVVATMRKNKGNVSKTIEALGISRPLFYLLEKEVPELAEAIAEEKRGRGSPRMLTYKGVTKSLGEFAEELGIKPRTLAWRLDRGAPLEVALSSELLEHGAVKASRAKKTTKRKSSATTRRKASKKAATKHA